MSDTPTHCPFCGSDEPDDCFDIQVRTERCYERQIAALKAHVAELDKINKQSCEDWAEDHTHLQKLCREAGCTEYEVEGDSYGVPGIGDLADLLAKKLDDETKRVAGLESAYRTAYYRWSEDHTHLQGLCREAGYSELDVDGDGRGFPSIKRLADMLAAKLRTMRKQTP